MKRLLLSAILLVCFITAGLLLGGSLPGVGTGQWTPAANMSDARDGAASALLQSGDILVTGGSNSAGSLQSADIYHIDGTLSAATEMQSARARHSATVLQDGRVLVVGGDTGGGSATSAAEVYDPVAGAWRPAGALANARFGHSATLLNDGRVAIVGGQAGGAPVTAIEIYDPSSNSFSVAASLTNPRTSHAAVKLADGRVLVAGGFGADANGNPIALNSVEIFDPVAGTVSAAPPMNVARGNHGAATVLDGLVVVTGGSDGTSDLASIETYNATTNTWTLSAATLSVPRSGHQATLLPANNSVLVSGGSSAGSPVLNADDYQPWTDTVVSGGAMNAPRVSGSGSGLGVEGLYLAAGGSGGKSTELHRFPIIKTDKSDYSPGTPVLMTGTGYAPGENVDLNLKQDDGDPNTDTIVQADASGNISYQGFAPDNGDVGTHFHLTASGQTSGFQAQTTFTDANIKVFSAPSGTSFTLSFQAFNSTSNCTGTPNNTGSQGILPNQQGNNGNVGVGNPDSVELRAPALDDQGGAFQNWSWATPLTNESVAAVGGTTAISPPTTTNPICIEAAATKSVNNGTFTATYSTAATAPTVTSANPNNGDLGTTENVILTGANFVAQSTVSFGPNITVNTTAVNSSTQITANISIATNAATGPRNVTVTNPGSGGGGATGTLTNGFTVNKRTTSTSVSCSPSATGLGDPTSCTATVTDNDTGTTITPTGSVNFSSNGTGTFSGGGSCTLSGSGASASCSVNYTPTVTGTGTHTITGNYGGDISHDSSTGTFNVTILSAPSISKTFGSPTIAINGSTSLSFTINNSNTGTALSGVAFTDNLPSGLVVSTPSGLTGSCGAGTITATAGSGVISLSGTTLAASGSCTFSVNVTGTTSGVKNNLTSTVSSTNGGTGNAAAATVTVASPPTISKAFGASTIPVNGTTTLTFTIGNPNSISLTGVAFTDTFPAGLQVASSPNVINSCGGIFTAPTSGSVSLSNGIVPTTGCAISLNVTGTTSGAKNNTTGPISSTNGGTGTASNTATVTVSSPPSISKAFGAGSIPYEGSTSLSFTINNPNTIALTGVSFTDALPAGLVVSTPNGLTGSCGSGTITAGGGSGSVNLSGGTIAANGSCSFSVNVTGTSVGVKNNTTSAVTSNEAGTGAASNTVTLTVAQASSTTTVVSSANPSVYGQPVTFTVTVLPQFSGTPGGNVTLFDGVSSLGTSALSGGSASFLVANLLVATHSITAQYGGDTNFTGSASATLLQMVNAAPTVTAITSLSASSGEVAQPVTVNFSVTSQAPAATIAPDGSVTVSDGTDSCSGTLTAGLGGVSTGSCALTPSTTGTKSIVASYPGDTNFTGSNSAAASYLANARPTTTTITLNPATVIVGQSSNVSVTVTDNGGAGASTPQGTVSFGSSNSSDAFDFITCTLSSGTCTVNVTVHEVGVSPHIISAIYVPNDNIHAGTQGSWALKTALPVATEDFGADTIDGKIYTAGGEVANDCTFTNTLRVYDPASDSWSTGTGMPTKRRGLSAAAISGTLYAVGGDTGCGVRTGANEAYDPVADSWTVKTSMPTPRTLMGVGVINGVLYTVGGLNSSNNPVGTVEAYDPAADTWTSKASMPTAREGMAVAVVNGKLYAISGSTFPLVNTVEVYDPTSDSWTTKSPIPTARTNAAAAVADGLIHVIGGNTGSSSNVVEAYDPASDRWFSESSVPTARAELASIAVNGTIYAIGGNTGTYSAANEAFAPGSTAALSVTKADTTTAVASSQNPSFFGQSVTFTATVSPVAPGAGTPTGTVDFKDGSTTIASGVALSGGQASFSTSALTAAGSPHSITAVYNGDPNFNATGFDSGSTTTALSQTVNSDPTSTTVSSSQNPSIFGESVTFAATVTNVTGAGVSASTPTGSVQFFVDGSPFGAAVPVSGSGVTATVTSGAISTLTVNGSPHTVTATYANADGNFNNSNGMLTGGQTVNPAVTSTSVSSSLNPSVFGQSVTFTATVADISPGSTATPTGSVQFVVDGVNFGSPMALTGAGSTSSTAGSGATATLTVNGSPHSVKANYANADGNFTNSSGMLTGGQTVNPAVSSTSVSSSLNPSIFGQSVTFTATVADISPGSTEAPTGSVQFVVDGVNFGSPVLLTGATATSSTAASGATATLNVNGSPHSVTANYLNADGNFSNSSGSLAGGQAVKPAATSTAVSSSLNPSTFGQAVNFTATVTNASGTGVTPTGAVQFVIDGAPLGAPVPLTGAGTATSTSISTLNVGGSPHSVVTNYINSDGNFSPSTGALSGGQTVNPAATSTSVISSQNPSIFGQAVTFTATVSNASGTGVTPTGSVQFVVDGTNLGTPVPLNGAGIAVSNPAATLAVSGSPHSVVANYVNADPNFKPSSGSLSGGQVVNPAPTSTSVASSLNPSLFGQALTLLATVSNASGTGVTPTGSVQFVVDGVNFGGPVALAGGTATSGSIATLNVSGSPHSVVASFTSNNGNFSASSGSLGQVVNPAPTSITIASSNLTNDFFNEPLTFTANVSSFATVNEGTVTVFVGASPVCVTGIVSLGVAVCSSQALTVGTHNITAVYNSGPDFLGSSAPAISQVVQARPTTTTVSLTTPIEVFQTDSISITVTDSLGDGFAVTPTGSVSLISTEPSDDFNPASANCTLATVSTGVASCQVSLTPIEPDSRTITATYAPDAVHVGSSGSADLMVTAAITSQKVCISSPFNGQSIAAGNTIWFSSVFQTRGPKITSLTHISFFNQTIQIGNSTPINVPDAEVVFDPNATSASTTYDGASTQWQTTLPTFNLAGKMFLTGFGYAVPAPIPGGTSPVTWCGFFASDSSTIDIGWQWGAAVYTSFSANNNVLGVKPVDDNKASVYQNSDQAGTPENYKPYVIGGARGGGGNNFTGGSSGSAAPL